MGAQCTAPPAQVAFEVCSLGDDAKNLIAPSAHSGKYQRAKSHDSTVSEDSTLCMDDSSTRSNADTLESASESADGRHVQWDDFIWQESEGSCSPPPDASIETDLAELLRLYQDDGDVVGAFSLLAKVETTLQAQSGGMAKWRLIIEMPLVMQLRAEIEKMRDVTDSCSGPLIGLNSKGLTCVYRNATGDQSLYVDFDPKSQNFLQYRVQVGFPVKLSNALAIASEVELSSHWNSLLVGTPEVLSRTGSTKMVVSSRISAFMGFIKNESLDEINRYIDEEAGIVVETMSTVEESSPMYSKPRDGFKRTDCSIKSLWVACGPEHTMLLQTGRLKLPFQCPKTLQTSLATLVGKSILSGLVRNSLRTVEPGNPWEAVLAKDPHGFYRRLDRCVQSEASQSRRYRSPFSIMKQMCF